MKRIPIEEFLEFGYLHELNRQFLHPLGLALEVVVEDDGTHRLGGVWDVRDDPEGLCFSDETLDPEKARRVAEEQHSRREARETALGYFVQPVE